MSVLESFPVAENVVLQFQGFLLLLSFLLNLLKLQRPSINVKQFVM